jgi:hypothetical protein
VVATACAGAGLPLGSCVKPAFCAPLARGLWRAQVFASIDTDDNGLLSYDEFSTAVGRLELDPPFTRSDIADVVDALDTNGCAVVLLCCCCAVLCCCCCCCCCVAVLLLLLCCRSRDAADLKGAVLFAGFEPTRRPVRAPSQRSLVVCPLPARGSYSGLWGAFGVCWGLFVVVQQGGWGCCVFGVCGVCTCVGVWEDGKGGGGVEGSAQDPRAPSCSACSALTLSILH